MDRLGKYLSLCLVAIMVVSTLLLFAKPIDAQTIPKPSVPEFTVRWMNYSYVIPATTTIDPYSGNVVNNPSQLRINYSIEVVINNKPTTETLRYNIRAKGHFESNWSSPVYSYEHAPVMSNQSTTSITFTSTSNDGAYRTSGDWTPLYAPVNGQMDFQVQAFVGYYTNNGDASTPLGSSMYFTTVNGEWSSTQTIGIAGAANPASSPTSSVPEFHFVAVFSLLVFVPLITIFLKKRFCIKAYN
jgi:hypothetical protein